MAPDTVSVRVPGSTSNCGSGFDTLGLALSIYNRVTVSRVLGIGPKAITADGSAALPMADEVARAFFARTRLAPFGFAYQIQGDVPTARGLGSSVTVRAGILAGLNALGGNGLSSAELVEIVTELEGHPDNAAAAILGGFCVARCEPKSGRYLGCVKIDVPSDLAFVVAAPRLKMLTKESRGILPQSLPYFDAVKSINAATFLVAVFATKNFDQLRLVMGDFMHEPYRLPRIPGASAAIEAGVKVGAYTGWLSGSGSSVLCVTDRSLASKVKDSMRTAFEAQSVPGDAYILFADNRGLILE